MIVDLALSLAPIRLYRFPLPNFTESSENRGLAPNCMAMPETTIISVSETKKLASASFGSI